MRIRVFSWLLLMSLFQILYLVRISGQCLNDQRDLLLQFKNGLVFDSSSSQKLVNWDLNIDCCNWDGVVCDKSGNVANLSLENEFISDGLENSTALFKLQFLQKLNLAFNTFDRVQIPKGLRNLKNLVSLNLSNAGFGGQVPLELSTMRKLVTLDLSSLFPGNFPLKLENPNLKILVQNLTELRELYLDGVDISAQRYDWSQALSSLPNLRNLSMKNCNLSGPLDYSLSQLHSLSVLRLDMNNLSTEVPEFFARLQNLTTLSLGSCSLRGRFPEVIFQVHTLQVLDLSNNALLNGTVSRFPQNGAFRTIVLSHSSFSGSLPDSISNLRMLSRIDLSSCNFTGLIPPSMANLTQLVYLDFSSNSFNGSIPLFNTSKKLTYIDLSRNSLTGLLSSMHFEGLSDLVYVNLGFNSLSGRIPQSLFSLPSLKKLQLSNNNFSGRVDEFSTVNSSNLDTLDLGSNQLKGLIPESFFKLESLKVLSLSSNSFSGTVKLEKIQSLRNLSSLELGYNNLSVDVSSLPGFPRLSKLDLASCNLSNFPDLRNQSNLIVLDLSNNRIKGEIPSWIWDIGNGGLLHLNLSYNFLVDFQKPFKMSTSIVLLDLHSNRLQGDFPMPPGSAIYVDYSNNSLQRAIPLDIAQSTSFTIFFSLANNNLSGTIPESLCNSSYLQVLDLSGNNLSGSIPSCLVEKVENLGVLNLGRNNISGFIPDSFPVNCSLKTLDLSENHLEGKIPISLANCSSLEVVNVGNNQIEDKFPCMLKNSSSLRVLVLRNNRFQGENRCPDVDEGWPNLQIIDIASNNFSGELYSKCIPSWKGMVLDNDALLGHGHLRFDFLNLNKFYFQDRVMVTIKGLELELIKILTVFTAIDFSCNNFHGPIPDRIGDLKSLYALNLSHNSLTGPIPKSVGNLSQLGSLDLSVNQLTGNIPEELASLTFLSFLNLSYNNLSGMIPEGPQLQTFSPSSYLGNPGFCELPLNKSCTPSETNSCGFPLNKSCNTTSETNSSPSLKQNEFSWQFIFTGLGYGFGAALVIAPLAFCKKWREKCNDQVDQLLKLIYPGYGFSYIRNGGKIEAVENIEDEITDDDDDDEEDEAEDELSAGRYCVFCTKLDIEMKKAMHNPKCTCNYTPPTVFSTPTSTSSSSSLLVVYH